MQYRRSNQVDVRVLNSPVHESVRAPQSRTNDQHLPHNHNLNLNILLKQRLIKEVSGKSVVLTCSNCSKLKQTLSFQSEIITNLQKKVRSMLTKGSQQPSPRMQQHRDLLQKKQLELISTVQWQHHLNESDIHSNTTHHRQNHHHSANPGRKYSINVNSQKDSQGKPLIQHQSLQPQSKSELSNGQQVLQACTNQKSSMRYWFPGQPKSQSLDIHQSTSVDSKGLYNIFVQESPIQEDFMHSGQNNAKLKIKSYNVHRNPQHKAVQPNPRTRTEKSNNWAKLLQNRQSSNSPQSLCMHRQQISNMDTIQNSDITILSNDSVDILNNMDQRKSENPSIRHHLSGSGVRQQKINQPIKPRYQPQSNQDLNNSLTAMLSKAKSVLENYRKEHKLMKLRELQYLEQIARLSRILQDQRKK